MKPAFAKWLEVTNSNERYLNLFAQKILGNNAEPVQTYGWKTIKNESEQSPFQTVISNKSYAAVSDYLLHNNSTIDSTAELRGVVFLHQFRKLGYHSLDVNIEQALGLINTNVNLDVDEFTSMFPLMVVNFPDELREIYQQKNKIFPSLTMIQHLPDDGLLILEHIYNQKDWHKSSTGVITFCTNKIRPQFQTIQEKLDSDETKEVMLPDAIDASKLAINSILLAQRHHNVVRLDSNPNDNLQKQFKRTMKGTGNYGKITQSSFWSFQNNLKTFNSQNNSTDHQESGRTNKPHWRRGHWKRVAHGEKRSERKWMHFPAVFVNAHKFDGNMAQTFTNHFINSNTQKL